MSPGSLPRLNGSLSLKSSTTPMITIKIPIKITLLPISAIKNVPLFLSNFCVKPLPEGSGYKLLRENLKI